METAPPDPTDEELIARSKEGDDDAFGQFVRRHTPSVHRWMARAVGEDDADDMTQEVFLRAYRGLPRFRQQAPPRAWLAAIADNAIKNRYRSKSRFRRIFAPDPSPDALADRAAGSASPEENAQADESRSSVRDALQKLPVEFRLPVVLRDLEEWSYEEIAVSLELPIGTVKSRIARGRGQLRAILLPLLAGERTP
ncbi:MAG TPA: sigma-70 family RNA polymerase sigma factor [Thermoanaerobaculia bacterium]|nr:sigma-70 family RNA polymerase sigma factor [Thermoanaerobaculia bacterium]